MDNSHLLLLRRFSILTPVGFAKSGRSTHDAMEPMAASSSGFAAGLQPREHFRLDAAGIDGLVLPGRQRRGIIANSCDEGPASRKISAS
jgi:hypothetical protein